MPAELLLVLSKARAALIIIGLTSLFEITSTWISRSAVFIVVLAALVFDSLVDEQRARTANIPPPRYSTAA
ncbi:hypothetical protein ACGF5F_32565 [Streptomyces sp. NPDC047821]|uniref:hypothetical protein n=1 Tax=Streptomyces sp. NPDC047821 TaxID=3365488 RepID=UPI00371C80B1